MYTSTWLMRPCVRGVIVCVGWFFGQAKRESMPPMIAPTAAPASTVLQDGGVGICEWRWRRHGGCCRHCASLSAQLLMRWCAMAYGVADMSRACSRHHAELAPRLRSRRSSASALENHRTRFHFVAVHRNVLATGDRDAAQHQF